MAAGTAWVVAWASPAAADQGAGAGSGSPGTGTIGTATEAWYNVTPACDSGGTCGPLTSASADPYPKGTLHVGIGQGQENARTYLHLNLSSLPPGTTLSGGTLTATVGGSSDGSQSAGSASTEACLVPESFGPSSGGFDLPAVDCSVKSPATMTGSSTKQMTVDLGPFVPAWSAHPDYGLALLPADDARASGASWHVALEGQGDSEAGARPITAGVTVQPAAPTNGDVSMGAASPGAVDQSSSGSVTAQAPQADQIPLLPIPMNAVATGPPAPAIVPNAAARPGGAAPTRQLATNTSLIGADGGVYQEIWLVPLGLVLVGGYFAFALTHEIRLGRDAVDDIPADREPV